ncbi:hypothetical protein D3C77_422380 [compost metagenome]
MIMENTELMKGKEYMKITKVTKSTKSIKSTKSTERMKSKVCKKNTGMHMAKKLSTAASTMEISMTLLMTKPNMTLPMTAANNKTW